MSLEGWQIGLLVGGVLLLLLVLSAVIVVACMVYMRRRDDKDNEDDDKGSEEEATIGNEGHTPIPDVDNVMTVGSVANGSANRTKQKKSPVSEESSTNQGTPASPLLVGNPLYNPQEYLYNFDNPTYDTEHGSRYDACVRIQTTYRGYRARRKWLRVRKAALVIQKWVRGFLARRRTVKYKVEKKRQQAERPAGGGKLKRQKTSRVGLLKGLALFDVKALGSVEVSKVHGEDTVRDALRRMKKEHGVKGKSKMKISVSPHGLKLFDAASMTQLAHIRITSVSYCSVDAKTNKVFAFIHNMGSKGMCYGFHCINNDADRLAKTVAEAYHLVFKRLQKVREKRQQQKTASFMATRAAEEARKLEADLDVHLEELESDFAELAQLMNQGVVSNLVNISDFGEVADFNLAASRSQLSLDSYDGASTDDFDGGRSHYTTSRSTLDDLDDDLPTQQLPAEVVGFSDLEDAFSKFEMAGIPAFDIAIEQFLQGDTSALDYVQQREPGFEYPHTSDQL